MWMRNKPGINLRSKTFRAFHYWGKLLGINPFSLSKKNQLEYSYSSILYNSFLIVLYCFAFYDVLIEHSKIFRGRESSLAIIVNYLATSCMFLENASTWLVCTIYQTRMKIIVKSFITAEKISEKLGIPNDCDKQFKKFGVYLILNNILFLASIITSNITSTLIIKSNLCVWIRFNLFSVVSFNSGITFIWCLILVRRKFRRLNESVQFLMQNRCANANYVDDGNSRLIRQSRCDQNILLERVNMISQLHRELRDIVYRIERHFALSILFSVENSITFLTFIFYGASRYMGSHSREAMDVVYVIAISHWVLYPIVFMVAISTVCGSTSDEANITGTILHKLINGCKNFRDIREAAKFNALSLDLLQNQVSISIFGFFKLDHFTIYHTLTTVTSYLVVMLQLNDYSGLAP